LALTCGRIVYELGYGADTMFHRTYLLLVKNSALRMSPLWPRPHHIAGSVVTPLVLTESPWLVSYLTSLDSIIVSLIVFEIFEVKIL